MPTTDYYQDAVKALSADTEGSYVLIYAQNGQKFCRWAIDVPEPAAGEWFQEQLHQILTKHFEQS